MLGWLLILVASSDGDVGQRLLDAALRSEAKGRAPEVERYLRAWASLGATPLPPDELARAAHEAEGWVLVEGRFRLFASRTNDRIRVGLSDPARIVTRIEAIVSRGGAESVLMRSESEASGRLEFVVDPSLPPEVTIEVRAVASIGGQEITIRRVSVAADAALPAPPRTDLPAVVPPPVQVEEPPNAIPWWWLAVGAIAAGLAGAAVVEELR
jgi:hypothetical protein